jgi:hypothetical protein
MNERIDNEYDSEEEMQDAEANKKSDHGFVPTLGPPNPQDEPNRIQAQENHHAIDIHPTRETNTPADECVRKSRSPALVTRDHMTLTKDWPDQQARP